MTPSLQLASTPAPPEDDDQHGSDPHSDEGLLSDPLLSSAPKLLGEPTLGRAGSGNLLQLLPLEKVEVLALVADVVVEIKSSET